MNIFTKVNILKLIYKNKIMLWGIDLGGTKIEGVVLESYDNPKEVSRIRINTEAQKGYNHVLNRIKELVLKLKKFMHIQIIIIFLLIEIEFGSNQII